MGYSPHQSHSPAIALDFIRDDADFMALKNLQWLYGGKMGVESMAAGVVIAKTVYDIVKDVAGYLKDHPDPVLEQKVLELREKTFELMEKDAELRSRVTELEEQLAVKTAVFFDKSLGAYFTGSQEAIKDGPFCAACYHEGKGLVLMHSTQTFLGGYSNRLTGQSRMNYADVWRCPSCGKKISRK